jgi:hypothetical protein
MQMRSSRSRDGHSLTGRRCRPVPLGFGPDSNTTMSPRAGRGGRSQLVDEDPVTTWRVGSIDPTGCRTPGRERLDDDRDDGDDDEDPHRRTRFELRLRVAGASPPRLLGPAVLPGPLLLRAAPGVPTTVGAYRRSPGCSTPIQADPRAERDGSFQVSVATPEPGRYSAEIDQPGGATTCVGFGPRATSTPAG